MEIVTERLDDFKELWSTIDQNLVSKLCDIMAKEIDVQIMSDSFDLLDELITKIEKKKPITKKGKDKKEDMSLLLHHIRFILEQYVHQHRSKYEALI